MSPFGSRIDIGSRSPRWIAPGLNLRKILPSILFAGGLLLAFPSAGFAESGNGAGMLLASAGEEALLFQEIPSVFAASRYEQKITEAPSSVSIVTAEEIRKYGYRTLADIIRAQRGFTVSYDRNYHYLGLRGFLRPGDFNSRVLLLIDGHRTNDAVYDAAGIGTSFILDIDLVDRVEFIRGPSSSLYGSNAFFGVINVITRPATAFRGAELSGEAGSFRTGKARATYGNRGESGTAGVVSGTWYRSRGDDRLYFPAFDDPLTHNGIAENADDDKNYSLFATVARGDFTLEGAYNERKKEIPTAPWDTFFNTDRTWTRDGLAYLFLQYDRYFESGFHLTAKVSYNDYWYDADYLYDWNADPRNPDLVVNRDEARGQWWGGEVLARKKIRKTHTLSLGAEYRDNFRQDQNNFDETAPPGVNLDDRRRSSFFALFFQDDFDFLRGLSASVGLRFDRYTTFGSTVNPRIALIADPREGTTVKFLYGRAFRAPSAYELYYHDGNVSQKAPVAIDPETIDTYELVVEQTLGEILRATASGYYYKVRDLINLEIDPGDGLLVFRNLGSVTSAGGSVELQGKWGNGLQGRASYSYQRSRDEQADRELENSPRHLAKFNLIAPILRERVFAGAEAQYTSSRRTVQGGKTSGFWLANLTVYTPRLWDRLDLSASLYNLFDRRYGDPGSAEHLQEVIEQDGLTFRIKATLKL